MTVRELRDWRTAQGMSQGELATALGVSRNTVGRWELGERAIPPFLELALASIAGEIAGDPRAIVAPAMRRASRRPKKRARK